MLFFGLVRKYVGFPLQQAHFSGNSAFYFLEITAKIHTMYKRVLCLLCRPLILVFHCHKLLETRLTDSFNQLIPPYVTCKLSILRKASF